MKKLLVFLSILFISSNTIAQENQFTNEIKAFRKQDSIQKRIE